MQKFLQICLLQPDFYAAAMVMKSAASTFPWINHLAVKIPHQDYMPKTAIKKKNHKKLQQQTNKPGRLQETVRTEMTQNKSLSFLVPVRMKKPCFLSSNLYGLFKMAY